MIYYTGSGTVNEIKVSLFGDGTSRTATVDLQKAPFNLDFKQNYPALFAVSSAPGPATTAQTITGKNGKLTFTFSEPLPAASLELRGPSVDIGIRFIYGAEGVETGPTRKKDV